MRRVLWQGVSALTFAVLLTPPHAVSAQDSSAAVQPASQRRSADVADVLGRTLAVHVEHVSLDEALKVIAARTGVRFAYVPEWLPQGKTVTLSADAITVRDALAIVLAGTDLEPVLSPSGAIGLHSHASAGREHAVLPQQGTATISGLVTDSGTGAIITQAIVHVDGTRLTVRTNATGHYTLSGLAAGEYRVNVRHVGYLSETHTITLADGDNKTVDFALNEPATTLNEVVTTAIGDARRYQVGNVISTINVDSIAPDAPVTSVTDLITGRAPGVDVVESSGMVGSGEDIRIRGVSSLLLQSDPIIIVDGIRVDNTAGGAQYFGYSYNVSGASNAPAPYRLNDLDVNQIATIEILKGPAATTEYGTDGANGVILITTKRGASGKPQWTASASRTASTVPLSYPAVTWNWGHTTNGHAYPFTVGGGIGASCAIQMANPFLGYADLSSNYYYPYGAGSSALESGSCVVDSTTAFNPLDHASTTEFGTGPASAYDLSVGGGNDQLRYYFAGGGQNQTGVLKVPDVFRSQASAAGFSNSLLQPNTQNQSSLRANTTIKASSTVDVQVSVGYASTYADFPDQSSTNFGGIAATNSPMTNYGYSLDGDSGVAQGPLATALGTNLSQGTQGWTASSTVNWRPASWLVGHVTAGLQSEAETQQLEYSAQAGLLGSDYQDTAGNGSLSQQQGQNATYNVRMNASATATLWHTVGVITTIGGEYDDSRSRYVVGEAFDLSASAFSLAGASNVSVSAFTQAVKSGGMYVEENLSFTDRCYAPIGIRFDVGSAYGNNTSATQNPNYSLTCTILSGRTSLRLRAAYGVSDQQPPYGANLGVYNVVTEQTTNDPSTSTVYEPDFPGNQQVKPERDQALEGGFDLGLWNGRVQVGFTAYNQRQHDLLWEQTLGWDLEGIYPENVGNHRNEGMEVTLSAALMQSRFASLGFSVNASVNHDKLLSLAPDLLSTQISGAQQFVVGYPLYGYWGDNVNYRDLNHDGILEDNEISFQDSTFGGVGVNYAGTSQPVERVSLAPTIGLWRNSIVVNAMFQYGGDYKVINSFNYFESSAAAEDPDMNVLAAPLWEQALTDELVVHNGEFNPAWADQFFNGTYVAWNELSVALNLPRDWVRASHLRTLSVVGEVRNLALWTAYPFGDPRVGLTGVVNNSVNNDVRSSALGVVPLTRQWTIRLNAGL